MPRVPSVPMNSRFRSRPVVDRTAGRVRTMVPSARTTSSPRTWSPIVPRRYPAYPIPFVPIAPPRVARGRDHGSWPRVRPLFRSRRSSASKTMPASAAARFEARSIDRTRRIRRMSRTIDSADGRAPPIRPVPPPHGTIDRPAAAAKRTTMETSSVERGQTTGAGSTPPSGRRDQRCARNASSRYRGGIAESVAIWSAPRRSASSENLAPTRTATRRPYSTRADEGASEVAQRGRFAVRRGTLVVLRREVDPGVRESHEVLFIALEGVSVAVIIDALPLMGNFKAYFEGVLARSGLLRATFRGAFGTSETSSPFLANAPPWAQDALYYDFRIAVSTFVSDSDMGRETLLTPRCMEERGQTCSTRTRDGRCTRET